MRNSRKQLTLRRAATAVLVLCLLAFQGALAGFANGAAGSKANLLAEICASASSSSSDDSSKSAPHCGGACCILQHNICVEPDLDGGTIFVSARRTESRAPLPHYRIGAVADAPELASSVPRGPPFLAV